MHKIYREPNLLCWVSDDGGVLARFGVATGDKYRARALELLAQAETATDAEARAKFENLAAAFLRLAIQAERNEGLVIDFELPYEDDKKPKH
jgi:hypothetical protein